MSVFSKFIVRKHQPYHYVVLVLITICLTFFIQRYAYLKITQIQQQKIKQYHQLNDSYQELLDENKALNDNLLLNSTNLDSQKHELDIQNATIQKLDQQLSSLQEQLASLNKELVFYQTITRGDRPNKLQIRELRLRPDATDSDIVHYQLVITQGAKINHALTGSIEMVVNAFQKESLEPVFLSNHPLNLRHVQLIEGQIKITEKVIPENVTITIMQKKKILLTQSFSWQLSAPSE